MQPTDIIPVQRRPIRSLGYETAQLRPFSESKSQLNLRPASSTTLYTRVALNYDYSRKNRTASSINNLDSPNLEEVNSHTNGQLSVRAPTASVKQLGTAYNYQPNAKARSVQNKEDNNKMSHNIKVNSSLESTLRPNNTGILANPTGLNARTNLRDKQPDIATYYSPRSNSSTKIEGALPNQQPLNSARVMSYQSTNPYLIGPSLVHSSSSAVYDQIADEKSSVATNQPRVNGNCFLARYSSAKAMTTFKNNFSQRPNTLIPVNGTDNYNPNKQLADFIVNNSNYTIKMASVMRKQDQVENEIIDDYQDHLDTQRNRVNPTSRPNSYQNRLYTARGIKALVDTTSPKTLTKNEYPTDQPNQDSELNTHINKIPASPISIKRATSPNIRDSDSSKKEHGSISTPLKTSTIFDADAEIFRPPSRISSPNPKKPIENHKSSVIVLSPADKATSLSNLSKENQIPNTTQDGTPNEYFLLQSRSAQSFGKISDKLSDSLFPAQKTPDKYSANLQSKVPAIQGLNKQAQGPLNFNKETTAEKSESQYAVKTEEELPTARSQNTRNSGTKKLFTDTDDARKGLKSSSGSFAGTLLNNFFNRGPDNIKIQKCKCDGYSKTSETCKKAQRWILRQYKESEFDSLESTYYQILQHDLEDEENSKQIQKDLPRTYPRHKYFGTTGEGYGALERILNAFAKYDPQIGYVQGMNFIAGSLLYHAEEYIAFWLLVMVIENFEMRDIFLPKLPGLTKHCQLIDILVASHQPDIYEKLCTTQIVVEMFCSEWIFSLFASVVSVDDMGEFYDRLFEEGWPFFYKVILVYLGSLRTEMLKQKEFSEILILLKSQNQNGVIDNKQKYVDWRKIFKQAMTYEVDAKFIAKMHSNFDVESQNFHVSFLQRDSKRQ